MSSLNIRIERYEELYARVGIKVDLLATNASRSQPRAPFTIPPAGHQTNDPAGQWTVDIDSADGGSCILERRCGGYGGPTSPPSYPRYPDTRCPP